MTNDDMPPVPAAIYEQLISARIAEKKETEILSARIHITEIYKNGVTLTAPCGEKICVDSPLAF